MSKKNYICERASRYYMCSDCPHSVSHELIDASFILGKNGSHIPNGKCDEIGSCSEGRNHSFECKCIPYVPKEQKMSNKDKEANLREKRLAQRRFKYKHNKWLEEVTESVKLIKKRNRQLAKGQK